MASGIVEGKPMIVIAGPRFLDFLVEGRRTSPPFTQRQRSDFALGLVHETVHLEKDNTANPAILQERLAEELRAWRKVDLNVVRELRRLNQPMNPRLIEADDALRSCGDKAQCESLREIFAMNKSNRQDWCFVVPMRQASRTGPLFSSGRNTVYRSHKISFSNFFQSPSAK